MDLLTADELRCLRVDGEAHVFMLDHDPEQAAIWHTDRHLDTGVRAAARLLATAWHLACVPARLDDGDGPPYLRWHVPRAQTHHPEPQDPADGCVMTGDAPFWTLCGQRIPDKLGCWPYPQTAVWASESGGNYAWLWRLGMSLAAEYTHRFDARHPLSVRLWTLELVPPALLASADEWSEAPLTMPEHMHVVAGEHYDAIASFRQYYATKQPLHKWTRRAKPAWIAT